ncbi:vitamin B12 ABC transporter ATP-binding protein BtuD [Vibrio sp. TRT 17S01]|uniref:vitamin B12 ABC transporter ATP-binding protein BtuD n=1 Tax=Vibrio sp. TRT 17S01 TaxID=3418505 RepID=UPI003CF534C8
MIRVNSLSVGSRLLPLSFDVQAGEVLHVIGPNGSGKSTLLSALCGLLDHKGSASIDGCEVGQASFEQLAQVRAFLSQSGRPAFNLDVVQYLSLSIPAHCDIEEQKVKQAVLELTSLLELQDKLHRSIHYLSGGEWQRVRLAAICLQVWPALNPYAKLLVLDEPAAPLDIGQEVLLYKLIHRIAEMGLSVVMSNHDLNRTLKYADKALLLDKGVLKEVGVCEDVLNEATLTEVFKTPVRRVSVDGAAVLLFD